MGKGKTKSKPNPRYSHLCMRVGATLRVLREQQGMSKEEMSRRTGMTWGTLEKYESGNDTMSLRALFVMCEALCIPLPVILAEPGSSIITSNCEYST